MATYILVHGAWHGGWCWHRVVARLQQAGHRALAPDLAGLGRDRTPAAEVTLERWTHDVCALVDSATEPVVLVGHSRGGIVISEVAERRPDRVRSLVYVTAFLLPGGTSLTMASATHAHSLVGPNMVFSSDEPSVSMHPESLREAFYGRCSDEDVELAEALLTPEPLAPLSTPLSVTPERFGRVPRVYVECTEDRAMTLDVQREMQVVLPCERTYTLESDHSPFLCCPDALTHVLLDA